MNEQVSILPNGLQLIFAPMQEVKSVTVMVFVGAGSRYETSDISGISHFMEHMFFKGTHKRPDSQRISEEIDAVGGEFNAGTSKEYTVYYVKTAATHLELSVDVLSDMLLNSKFEAAEIESEKGVILEELKMYEDMPMRDIGDIYELGMYGDHPLGWKTVGTRKSIKATDREKMLAFKERFYTSDNMIIGIAGNFDSTFATELIKTKFAGLATRRSGTYAKAELNQSKPQFSLVKKATEQAHLCLGMRTVERGHVSEYAAKVLNVILGGNMSSRLFIEVREKQKLCYYVHSSLSSYFDAGSFDVQAGVDLTRIPQAIESILGELKRFKAELVTDKELHNAKEYLKGKMVLALEDTEGMVEWLGMQKLLRGSIRSIDEIIKAIDAVSAAEVKTYAETYFIPSRLNLTLIAPGDRIEPVSWQDLLQI